MAQQLSLLSETEFEHRAPEGFPLVCPTLDLSATWEIAGKNVLVHRPPGQVVSKIHQTPPPGGKTPDALAVTWKADGQFLAIGWSDGVVRLMGLENNKAAHHIEVFEASDSAKIAYIGWSCNRIATQSSKSLSSLLQDGSSESWEELGGANALVELPRELTFLEIETALPKISPLPSSSAGTGEDAVVFTLRTGIDFLFQAPKSEEYDQVNVMIVGSTDGKIHLSIYDSFVIGSFQCPQLGSGALTQPILIASTPDVSTHALLMAEQKKRWDELHLLPMDLPFISSVPINLSLLASKLTTLQKLLRYLKQTQLHMQFEWNNTRELPTRFLRSVEGGLEEMTSGPRDIVPALYHTVVTGHAYEPVREWIVDSLAERGHKRWDKAVVSGLENLRSLIHENFLPALERCTVILSRLKGLAQFHDSREDIGFSATQISKVMDIVSSLTLVGHKALIVVMDELEHFTSFSSWLRFQIDRLNSPGSETEELTEKEATMDIGKVLTYIEQYLVDSPLRVFFGELKQEDRTADWELVEDGQGLLDLLTAQMKKHEAGQDAMKALPRVEFLVDYASHCSNRVFEDIAEAKKRSIRFGKPIRLAVGQPIDHFDMRICKTSSNEAMVFAALASKDTTNRVHVFRAGLEIINGISSNRALEICTLDLGNRKLIDFKFLATDMLIALCNDADNTPTVICVPLKSGDLIFKSSDGPPSADEPSISCEEFVAYKLPEDRSIKPIRMEVREQADTRGHVPARICLLGGNRTTLFTFTLLDQE